MLDHVTISKL